MKIFRMSKEGLNKAEKLNPSSPTVQKEAQSLQEQLQENTKQLQEVQKIAKENSENLDKATKNTKDALDDINKIKEAVKKNNIDPGLKESVDAARKNGVSEEKILKNNGKKDANSKNEPTDEETKKEKQKFLNYAFSNPIIKTAYDEFRNNTPFSYYQGLDDELDEMDLPRKETRKVEFAIGEIASDLTKICNIIHLCKNGNGNANDVNTYYNKYDKEIQLLKKYTNMAKEELNKLKSH